MQDPIDEYLKERLPLKTPIVNLIHKVTYQKLYELVKGFEEWKLTYFEPTGDHTKSLRKPGNQ